MAEESAGSNSTVVFREDFNNEPLSDQWEVRNGNADTMIIEDGMLQIVTGVPKKGIFDPENFVAVSTEHQGLAIMHSTPASGCLRKC